MSLSTRMRVRRSRLSDKDQHLDRQLEYSSSLSNAEGNYAVIERDLGA